MMTKAVAKENVFLVYLRSEAILSVSFDLAVYKQKMSCLVLVFSILVVCGIADCDYVIRQ